MAPEYAYEGFFSSKSDVFSFGVLLLEIVSGKRNSVVAPYGGHINILGYVSAPMTICFNKYVKALCLLSCTNTGF